MGAMTRLAPILCCLIAASPSAAEFTATVTGDRLPLITGGAELDSGKDATKKLERVFRLPTKGVWYVWLRVSAKTHTNSILKYSLNGAGYRSARGRVTVQPSASSQWLSHSDYKEFNLEVHADRPGDHRLALECAYGKVNVEKIALTLFFSAKPKGDTLDHANDPGMGRAFLPESPLAVDGFRPDWPSPAIKAKRSFHVDAEQGDDSRNGSTPATAWRTLGPVNAKTFLPGDAILLKRGGRWEGGLRPLGSGTKASPITLGAYGTGRRPVIDGVTKHGLHLEEQSWWTIQDLELTSDPAYGKCGLAALTFFGKPQPRGIRVYNVIAYDNGPIGILVGSFHGSGNGYDGVHIENCLAYAHDSDGIVAAGSDQTGCRNTMIRHCTAYSNLWSSGVFIMSGQNGVIERCVAYSNACINIWAWNAINITMRDCEAYRGRTPRDAGGFDIDWGVEASVLERCYSHHNEGVGILLMGGGTGTYRKLPMHSRYNLARFNVSENDNPGIGMVETFEDGFVHNNTVVTAGNRTALDVSGWPVMPDWGSEERHGGWPARTGYFNNILVGLDGATPSVIDDWASSTQYANSFDDNVYWRDTPGALIKWGGRRNGSGFWLGTESTDLSPPVTFSDLPAFRKATNHEANGRNEHPKLSGIRAGVTGRLPLDGYRLPKDSPLAAAGKPVVLTDDWYAGRRKYLTETGAAEWGVPMEPAQAAVDYWSGPLPASGGWPAGAGR